jgi:NAD(P)-dependent dehydrogenase (short-subunit alcohol dehydrogenase family)
MELTGKVTVVTGSASGLGRATVMPLVSNGALRMSKSQIKKVKP